MLSECRVIFCGEANGMIYATFCLPLDYKVREVDKATISMIALL